MIDVKTWFSNKLKEPDLMQRVNVYIFVCFELYRSIISSFLILFVPQKCGYHSCNTNENLLLIDELYITGLVMNFFTMMLFVILYFVETIRENELIGYLGIDKSKYLNDDSVSIMLENIENKKRDSIYFWNRCYQISGYITIISFTMNSVISGIIVYNHYLDSRTTTSFITNVFFMTVKLVDIQTTFDSEKDTYYSAYLKRKIQFNIVESNKFENSTSLDSITIETDSENS
jgi:hypothetical protein